MASVSRSGQKSVVAVRAVAEEQSAFSGVLGFGQFRVSAKPWAYSDASARLSEDSRSRDSPERFWPVSTNAKEARPTVSMIAIRTMALTRTQPSSRFGMREELMGSSPTWS